MSPVPPGSAPSRVGPISTSAVRSLPTRLAGSHVKRRTPAVSTISRLKNCVALASSAPTPSGHHPQGAGGSLPPKNGRRTPPSTSGFTKSSPTSTAPSINSDAIDPARYNPRLFSAREAKTHEDLTKTFAW